VTRAGTLYVVATPLGNLEDISPRALAVLRKVSWIACEDTRRTGRLLARYGIDTSRVSCHRFNERARLDELLGRLRDGVDVALVSDGGTPVVSDPGALLVAAVLDAGLPVSPVPGPSAPAALLSASGLPGDRYVFEGFLPHRAGERRRRLRELATEARTVVLFETPHRIRDTLIDLAALLGDRRMVLGRELTKVHEQVLAGSAQELLERLAEPVRGEITLIIAGAPESSAAPTMRPVTEEDVRTVDAWTAALERNDGDRRKALRETARELGSDRPTVQRRLAELGRLKDGRRRR